MPGQPFFFQLEFVGDRVSAALLEEVKTEVLRHVGPTAAEEPALAAALTSATDAVVASGAGCDLRLHLQSGSLEIVVSANGGPLFHASHPINSPP